MKNTFKSIAIICFLLASFSVLILASPYMLRGINLYQDVIENVSFEDISRDIKANANYIELDQVSNRYISELIKSEDKRFYYHNGIDYIAIGRALYHDVKSMKYIQGGSTITQQLAKNLFFSFDKKVERKIAEVLMAKKLESEFTKKEILEMYVNVIYFGENCYGIKKASNHYFNTDPDKLSSQQIKSLVKTIKSPNNYNPNKLPIRAKAKIVEKDMVQNIAQLLSNIKYTFSLKIQLG